MRASTERRLGGLSGFCRLVAAELERLAVDGRILLRGDAFATVARLLAADAARDRHEVARIAERFEVEQEAADPALAAPVLDQVVGGHGDAVRGVPRRSRGPRAGRRGLGGRHHRYPQSRRASRLPKYRSFCWPCAIFATALVILRVTNVSPLRGDSWLNNIPFRNQFRCIMRQFLNKRLRYLLTQNNFLFRFNLLLNDNMSFRTVRSI